MLVEPTERLCEANGIEHSIVVIKYADAIVAAEIGILCAVGAAEVPGAGAYTRALVS